MANPNLNRNQRIPGNLTIGGDLTVLGKINRGAQQQFVNVATPSSQPSGQFNPLPFYTDGQFYNNPGVVWQSVANSFAGSGLFSIAYGNGVFVATSVIGTIARSTDGGLTWGALIANPFLGNSIFIVAYGNGVFVAAGATGTMARSTDGGLTWGALIVNPFGGNSIYGLVYNNGIFVATGQNGTIARSTDLGLTWGALIANPFGANTILNITYGNGVFIAVAQTGTIARSTDGGLTWGALISNPFGVSDLYASAYGNGIFVVAGVAGKMARSIDLGLTWGSLIVNPFGANIVLNIAYGNGIFVATGQNGTITRSTDLGLTWGALIPSPFIGTVFDIALSDTSFSFVAVGANGIIALSPWLYAIQSKEYPYTPTFTGFGVVTNVNFTWTREGNRIKVMGKFTAGIPTAVEARISLPGSLISDATLITAITDCGTLIQGNAAVASMYCLIESGVGYITIGVQDVARSGLTKVNGNAITTVGNPVALQFEFGISGWN